MTANRVLAVSPAGPSRTDLAVSPAALYADEDTQVDRRPHWWGV